MKQKRREQILALWQDNLTGDQIADRLNISRDAVFWTLRQARKDCDCRASRRPFRAPARRTAIKIAVLRDIGMKPTQIARIIGVSQRLVQMRLKEAVT